MAWRDINNVANLMFANKSEGITGEHTYYGETMILSAENPTNGIIYSFEGKDYNWKSESGSANNPIAIMKGLCFRWGSVGYHNEYVLGTLRGTSYSSNQGFGIGKLEADGNITPLFRIAADGLYFKEKKITD